MTAALRTLRLAWPREVATDQLAGAMRLLSALAGTPVVLECLGRFGRVEHRLSVVENRVATITSQLRAAIPGLGIEGFHGR